MIKQLKLTSLAAALILSNACVVEDDPGEEDTDTDPTTMTMTDPTPGTMTDPTPGTMTESTSTSTGPDPDTTDTETDTTDPDTDTDTDTDTDGEDGFDFRDDDPSAYTRVDRKGFPAINTALISPDNKDAYNAANPTDDVAGMFAQDAVDTLQFLHGSTMPGSEGLNDDLVLANTLLGTDLTPCGATVMNNTCLLQAVPLAFPDVVLLNTGEPSAFPNGRTLEVPVIDIILAAVLIEAESVADLLVFTDLDPEDDEVHGLSQSPNDVAFPGAFPYLAPAHE